MPELNTKHDRLLATCNTHETAAVSTMDVIQGLINIEDHQYISIYRLNFNQEGASSIRQSSIPFSFQVTQL